MSRLLIVPLALLASTVHAQNLTYVDMAEVSGTDLVRVVKIEDLAALIKTHKEKSVLRSADQFALQVGSVLYAMEAKSSAALYGRKMYEMMSLWEQVPKAETMPECIKEYERAWKRMKKFVYSSTLREVVTANTVLEKSFVKRTSKGSRKTKKGPSASAGRTWLRRPWMRG